MGSTAERSRIVMRRLLPALGVFAAGFCMSLLLSAWLSSVEKQQHSALFAQEANERFEVFAKGLTDAAHALNMVNRLFYTLEHVSREQFEAFTAPLLEKHPHMLSLTFQRNILGTARGAFQAKIRSADQRFQINALRDQRLTPPRGKNQYRIVDYIAPINGNEKVLGLDASSIPELEAAAVRSALTGEVTSTQLFPLVRGNGQDFGFWLLKPVYRKSANLSQRSLLVSDILGYTGAAFDAHDFAYRTMLLGGFLSDVAVAIDVYAGDTKNPSNLVFNYTPGAGALSFPEPRELLISTRTITVGGMDWTIAVKAPADNGHGAASASWIALGFGMILTAVLAIFVYRTLQHTWALKRSNETLRRDVALREETQQALCKSEAELRALAIHQQRVREDERKHIAREIHDDLGQNLLVLRMDVSALAQKIEDKCPEAKIGMNFALNHIDTTIKSTRDIINHLRPSVLDLGPYDALQWLMSHMNKLGKVKFTFDCEGEAVFAGIKEENAISLFRAVQEAMTNVIRHANGSVADIRARRDEKTLCIEVADNGSTPFPNDKRKPRSFGLIGIRERLATMGGELVVTSTAGQGTTVKFTIPMDSSPE